jgi:glycosyltransferase involved in cell wall biosynthesis
VTPDQLTIAVTVYDRRDFVLDAVRSALEQTVPVKVLVVEDCSPDAGMREFIAGAFDGKVQYCRNPRNRGLFDNWNACMEYCATPWLSILHDDDLLRPRFVETMIRLAGQAPGRALYFSQAAELTDAGRIRPAPMVAWPNRWRDLDPLELAESCFLMFPGQMFLVSAAQALGGFRQRSFYTADWDMWFRLLLRVGATQSAEEVAVVRSHYGPGRGTTRVERMGWRWALDNVQRKRNLALLRAEKGIAVPFERAKVLQGLPMPSYYLLRYARGFSRRLLAYNLRLFLLSKPPHLRYAALQAFGRILGPPGLRLCSALWNRWRGDMKFAN